MQTAIRFNLLFLRFFLWIENQFVTQVIFPRHRIFAINFPCPTFELLNIKLSTCKSECTPSPPRCWHCRCCFLLPRSSGAFSGIAASIAWRCLPNLSYTERNSVKASPNTARRERNRVTTATHLFLVVHFYKKMVGRFKSFPNLATGRSYFENYPFIRDINPIRSR